MNNIWKFLSDNDNIKTVISVLAFILSVINTFYLFFTQRPKIKASFKEYTFLKNICDKPFLLGVIIENKSRLPVSISKMNLSVDNVKYEFSWIPIILYNSNLSQNDKVFEKTSVHSLTFPQHISSLGSCCGYFAIITKDQFDAYKLRDSKCILEVYTSRGKKSFKIDFSNLDNKLSR